MKNRLLLLLIAFLPLLTQAQASKTDSQLKLIEKSREEALESYLSEKENKEGFSGVVLIIKDGKTLIKKAYGKSDIELSREMRTDSKFPICSITKMFTAICVLDLEEEKKLKLNDRLNKYFPEIKGGEYITIRMLLNHTSGLPRDVFKTSSDMDFVSKRKMSDDSVKIFLLEEMAIRRSGFTRDSIISLLPGIKVLSRPGTYYYSNLGYILLGYIIEKVSGQTYADYVTKNIFQPLKMENSGVCEMDPRKYLCVNSYYHSLTNDSLIPSDQMNMNLIFSSGNIYSTVDDLNKLDIAFKGYSILSYVSKSKMFTEYKNKEGLGVSVAKLFGLKTISHSGGIMGYDCQYIGFPANDALVIVFSNKEIRTTATEMAASLTAIIFDKKYRK